MLNSFIKTQAHQPDCARVANSVTTQMEYSSIILYRGALLTELWEYHSILSQNIAGIFVSPNEVVKQVGSPGMALVIWVLSGLISLTGRTSLHFLLLRL